MGENDMTKAKHTPGPLTVHKSVASSDFGIISQGKYVVAETFSDIRRHGEGAAEEALANATLYAAAPEMLDALKMTYAFIAAEYGDAEAQALAGEFVSAPARPVWRVICAAIAKAEGDA
jgi:hypothetical protein